MDATAPRDAAFAASVVSDIKTRLVGLRTDLFDVFTSAFDRGQAWARLTVLEDSLLTIQVMLERQQKEAAK